MFTLRETDRTPFERALAKANAVYDEEWKAPAGYLDKANYHTNLARQTVHSTRDAFGYAAALLASGREEDLSRAEEILWNVSAQQDKNPANATYGIWSWYMEEPLEKMSPPDWNWADFCGKEILQVLAFHGDRISKDLRAELEDALRHACLSIFRRNMHAAYTNISIMGSYVTLHAGQLLGWPWLFSYGKERFRGFVRYTRGNHGAFAEYNSATYTSVAIEDLTRIHTHIRDGEVHAMAGEMLDDAWRTIADHFHAPTRQWCGPNARSYTWLTAPGTLSFLEQATGHGISLTDFNGDKSLPPFSYSLGWAYVDLCCPDKYRKAFCEPEEKDVNVVFRTEADLRTSPAAVAVFHKEKDFALGSFAAVSAWNQRRGFLAFWGGERPRFLNLAALHNLYDFSSGMFTIAQDGGHALILAVESSCDETAVAPERLWRYAHQSGHDKKRQDQRLRSPDPPGGGRSAGRRLDDRGRRGVPRGRRTEDRGPAHRRGIRRGAVQTGKARKPGGKGDPRRETGPSPPVHRRGGKALSRRRFLRRTGEGNQSDVAFKRVRGAFRQPGRD